ncbi:calmodulin-binding receptor-like cytoplasmic kinase 2 isoform X1 [Silene latifolia]|uniref:calmodulin-binding receptor-like cytoplasmic kinase 2 isoform X1 n=1 Tax=Silene latifolia TaxID=37657 RepID=UPI003D776CFA
MSSTPKHDHASARSTKALNQQKNKSFLISFKAAVRKIVVVFTAFGSSKSKGDVFSEGGESYGVGGGGRRSSHADRNSSSGFSSGSKNTGSSPYYNGTRSSESSKLRTGEFLGSLNFTLDDIQKVTKNFSQDNLIGEGGFGTVFKGQLQDGTQVAVKRARKDMTSKRTVDEFRSEVLAFSKIEHLNLVKFYGYLEHPDEKIIVVEYVSNGTLFDHLHGSRGFGLELAERLDIAIDVAHAVTYLHTYNDPPIIHRDIKSSNVLITERLRAKVTDFGLARLVPDGADVTHISTQIKGTVGYLDPEYMKSYQLTEKSDVYSFGVLLVELVTGRHPIEPKRVAKERMTPRWALSKLKEGMPVLAMDPKLQRSPPSIKAVEKILELARKCTGLIRQSRPTMKECVETLWAIRKEFKGAGQLGNFSSHRSVDLLEKDARKVRQQYMGGESYSFMSA